MAEVPKVGDSDKQDSPKPNSRLSNESGDMLASNQAPRNRTDASPPAALPQLDIVQGSALNLEEFSSLSGKLFRYLDKTKDGTLSKEELAAAVRSEKFTGSQAQVIAALYSNFKEFSALSNDRMGKEKNITFADLKAFRDKQSDTVIRLSQAEEAASWSEGLGNFENVDSNHDGTLSPQELSSALADHDPSDLNYGTLQFLKDNAAKLQKADGNGLLPDQKGITKEDLKAHHKRIAAEDISKAVLGASFSIKQVAESQNPEYPNSLYKDRKNPRESIQPDAINQGSIGNCYFEAAIASVAATNPQIIKDMIKENRDGTFTVTFPGDKANPMTVKRPTEIEMGIYNGKGPYGIWPNVMEKAFGKYEQLGFWKAKANTDPEGADGGGNPADALKLLTGTKADYDDLAFTRQDTVYSKLNAAFRENRAVVCGYGERPHEKLLLKPGHTASGFIKNHAFSVVGFEPKENGDATITIRNPWGYEEIGPRGTTTISFKEFMKNFNTVIYEEPESKKQSFLPSFKRIR